MLAVTAERVCLNTSREVNERIRRQTEGNIERAAAQGAVGVDRRLRELDEEWDIERCLETMAPTITLVGLTLGVTVNKKFLLIPAIVQTFFLQHALQGWCPPLPVLRRLGVRTAEEINQERFALKALRGDFAQSGGQMNRPSAFDALAIARRT
jgi:hypothetical protein